MLRFRWKGNPLTGLSSAVEAPLSAPGDYPSGWGFFRAGRNLTLATAAFTALAFVTGPILARALGPAGRGDLAAILVPLALAPAVALLGLDTFAARQAARGTPRGTLALSVGPLLLGTGAITALAGIPLSALLAEGRPVVRTFLLIGFASMPFILIAFLLIGISSGLARWRLVIATRLVPQSLVTAGLILLFFVGSLTIASGAAVYLLAPLSTLLIGAQVLRGQRLRFDWRVIKEAVPFGAKACVSTTADLANLRLDQLLMINLVAPRELGLYAVAASFGGFASILTSGISPPLLARISTGEVGLAPRALRTTLTVIAVLTFPLAVSIPFLLAVLFGEDFMGAMVPTWVLLAAGLPFTGTGILTQTLNGVGRPGLPAVGQATALVITVSGLLLILPLMGALGAALVSLVAYSANFLILLTATVRTCPLTVRQLLVPTRADLRWLRGVVRSSLGLRHGAGDATS